MTLRNLLADGRIRSHKTSAKEISDLMRLVKRDMADAGLVQLSADRRFATAYNASNSKNVFGRQENLPPENTFFDRIFRH